MVMTGQIDGAVYEKLAGGPDAVSIFHFIRRMWVLDCTSWVRVW